ncbi:putative RNA splicing factor [Tieghemostelium lacteum]|uniref:Splicing factor YJU2 n=1 Tax=Tieghemostelium lacteum TaxID=361077 RepID=A0A152A495_TIELA|nr:putative RNA splicing factor [Tieghemostelium lacteum]|eukprot:KYR01029.1 putative RNA splicing factor [Tieghemostelium lacteum]
MGERKVISKYYPPDFDPSKIAKTKVKKSQYTKVTTMLPMSIRCNTCGEYIGRGTKFNAKKETVIGEDYLGLKIYRFFIRCKKCAAELTIKTDPKNSQYICEFGATKNYEPWLESTDEKEERLNKEAEEKQDAMKALENRSLESKREMERLEELEDLKAQSARKAEIDITQILENSIKKQQELEREIEIEEEKIINEVFRNRENLVSLDDGSSTKSSATQIKRIDNSSDKFSSLFSNGSKNIDNSTSNDNNVIKEPNSKFKTLDNIKVLVSKKVEDEKPKGLSLMANYSSDEEDD